jgi:hypothetical protein
LYCGGNENEQDTHLGIEPRAHQRGAHSQMGVSQGATLHIGFVFCFT